MDRNPRAIGGAASPIAMTLSPEESNLPLGKRDRIAAEVFSIPYHAYAGRARRRDIPGSPTMVEWIAVLETAEEQRWENRRVASILGCELEDAEDCRRRYREAVEVVHAADPMEGFRIAIRNAIATALAHRGLSEPEIDDATSLVSVRVADLLYLIKHSGRDLDAWMAELSGTGF